MSDILQATDLPFYEPEYDFPRCLNGNSSVQRVSSGLVAKFIGSWEYIVGDREIESSVLRGLENEYNILRDAYQAGVSVPKPEGLFLVPKIKRGFVNHVLKRKLPTPAILMQYIDGIPMNRLGEKMWSEACELRYEERKRARQLGFDPADFIDRNAIYCPSERRVYLVDVNEWGRD